MVIYFANGQWTDSDKEHADQHLLEAIDFMLSSFGYERLSLHSWKKGSRTIRVSSTSAS